MLVGWDQEELISNSLLLTPPYAHSFSQIHSNLATQSGISLLKKPDIKEVFFLLSKTLLFLQTNLL